MKFKTLSGQDGVHQTQEGGGSWENFLSCNEQIIIYQPTEMINGNLETQTQSALPNTGAQTNTAPVVQWTVSWPCKPERLRFKPC